MADYSNYGILFKYGTSGSQFDTIAGLTKVSYGGVKNPKVEGVPVSGVKTFISGNLAEFPDIKATMSFDKSIVGSFESYCISGSALHYQFVNPNTRTYQFKALITEFVPGDADMNNPDLQNCVITLSPSGSMVIS